MNITRESIYSLNLDREVFIRPSQREGIKTKPSALKTVIARISPAAARAFLELAAAFAVNTAIIVFFASPLGAPLSILGITPCLMSLMAMQIVKMGWQIYSAQLGQADRWDTTFGHFARFSIVNGIGLGGLIPFIHEYLGHAVAAKALFKNPNIRVQVFPYRGGHTTYTVSKGLTKIGALLGKENSILFVTAAGMMASTLIAMFEFGVAYKIKDQYPLVSEYLTYHGIAQLLSDVVYGLTTFFSFHGNLSHDFMRLWNLGGIHPLIPITLMVALPVAELVIFKLLEMRKQSREVSRVASEVILHN